MIGALIIVLAISQTMLFLSSLAALTHLSSLTLVMERIVRALDRAADAHERGVVLQYQSLKTSEQMAAVVQKTEARAVRVLDQKAGHA